MRTFDTIIRKATLEDVPAITALVKRAYEKYVFRIGRKPWPMEQDYAEVVLRTDTRVLDYLEEIRAVLVLIPEPDVLLIENVAVDPDHQGNGHGTGLLYIAESEARRRGCSAIRLYTNEKMTENIAFYERNGYVETSRETLRGLNVVHMRKALTQP